MTHLTETNAFVWILFIAIAVLLGVDLVSDASEGAPSTHLLVEAAAMLLATLGLAGLGLRYREERASSERWRTQAESLLAGVGAHLETQFTEWQLSPAESEVALLLLKGLSFKEIGSVRETSERTSRDQARAVYKKAGIAGRAELSAWFMEDLWAPAPAD